MSDAEADAETPIAPARKTARAAASSPARGEPEMPETFRDLAVTGIDQAKDTYARLRHAAEEATDLVEDTYLLAVRGTIQFNLRATEALRTNVNANFDHARDLLAAKSLSEAVALSSSHMRQQFETLTAQARELSAFAQKVAAETAEPLKASISRNGFTAN